MRLNENDLEALPAHVRQQIEQKHAAQLPGGKRTIGRPEQEAGRQLIRWADSQFITAPWNPETAILIGDYLAHNANGGARTATEGAILRGQGVRKGWPDYTLYLAVGRFHGMVLELKAPDGAKPEPEQLEIMARLEAAGWHARVAWGGDDAIRAVQAYLDPC